MITISHVFISSVGKGVWTGVYHDYRISLAYNKTVNSFACIGKQVFSWIVLVYFLSLTESSCRNVLIFFKSNYDVYDSKMQILND